LSALVPEILVRMSGGKALSGPLSSVWVDLQTGEVW